MIKQVKEYPRYFVVAIHTGLYLMHWEENEENLVFKLFATVDSDKPANNIADGSIDAQGRLVFGKTDFFSYSITKRKIKLEDHGITESN